MQEAKIEFNKRVAEDPMPLLLPVDVKPTTEFAWPDYSTTPDGERVWYPKLAP